MELWVKLKEEQTQNLILTILIIQMMDKRPHLDLESTWDKTLKLALKKFLNQHTFSSLAQE